MMHSGTTVCALLILLTTSNLGLSRSQAELLTEVFPVVIPAPGFFLSPTPRRGGGPLPRVTLEFFLDMSCKDSRASWEHIQAVAEKYHKHSVAVKIFQFPLPYHRNSMVLAQAALMVLRRKPEALEKYLGMVFDHLHEWRTCNTLNQTDLEVLERLVGYTEQLTGLGAEEIKEGIKERNRDVRHEWKLGCSRGVSGTPSLFVNGVRVGVKANVTLDGLSEMLDRLLSLGDGGEEGGDGDDGTFVTSSAANSGYKFW